MGWEVNKKSAAEEIIKKPKASSDKTLDDRKVRLSKFFGALSLKEDAVTLQRRWRDEC